MVLRALGYASKTLDLFNKQRLAKNCTDFSIFVAEEEFCVHHCLFNAHSLLFRRTFEGSKLDQVGM